MMEKPKITPGPWKLNPNCLLKDNERNYFHISARDWTSEHSFVQVLSWEQGSHPIKECTDRWKADAKAISAVPDMIDALMKAHEILNPFNEEASEVKAVIGLALKKAGVKFETEKQPVQ